LDISNTIILASITRLVVEMQQLKKRCIEAYQLKPSHDMTCLNPNNLSLNMSGIETYNASFERGDLDISNTISPASTTRLVVEMQ
jgi:hypothetical protein